MKLKELEKRLKTEPNNLGLRVQVAGVLREAGRSIEAVEHYRFVALAYRDQGRAQQAIAVCRSILEIAPEDSACQGLIAMLQGRTTRPALDEVAVGRSPKSGSVPDLGSRAATNSSGPVSVGSVPSLRAPTARPTQPPEQPSQVTISRPTPDERPLSRTTEPTIRRSVIDETPLPQPLPYHLADRTSQPSKVSSTEIDPLRGEGGDTLSGIANTLANEQRRSEKITGLAQAARRISGLISDPRGVPSSEMDLAAELDTRQRARIAPEQLQKIDRIPTSPVDTREMPRELPRDTREMPREVPRDTREMPGEIPRDTARDIARDRGFIDRLELDDLTTPPPGGEDVQTEQVRVLTPIPRGSDDALTPPPMQPARRPGPSVPPPARRPTPSVPAPASTPVARPPSTVPTLRSLPSTVLPQRSGPTSPPLPSLVTAKRSGPTTTTPPLPPHPQRAAPSVPSPAQRSGPMSPPAQRSGPTSPPPQRPGPTSPPPQRAPFSPPPRGPAPNPSQTSTTLRGVAPVRLTPTSLPPPPSSNGSPSRPQLVVAIPLKSETSSRPSIRMIPTRGTKSNPPSDVDEELTQPRDRQGLDEDD